jgi:tRNA(adenine34) deaminase
LVVRASAGFVLGDIDNVIVTVTVASDAEEAWESLEESWQECLDMAWEAHSLGAVPVGAVLVDPDEHVVTTGRNGVYGQDEPLSGVDGRLLAHAEVNALLHLDPELRYERHTLYGSLEPCMLCIGAATVATVGTVRFAGIDPYGGASHFVGHNRATDRLRFEVEGPLEGPFGVFAAALHVEFYLRRNPDGQVVKAYRDSEPGIVSVAEVFLAKEIAEVSSRGEQLPDFLPRIWNVLVRNAE